MHRLNQSSAAQHRPWVVAAAALAFALLGARARATDLSYTYVDFGGTSVDSSLVGTKQPTATQQVGVESTDGDGLMVAGSLALGRHFYLNGGYESNVVESFHHFLRASCSSSSNSIPSSFATRSAVRQEIGGSMFSIACLTAGSGCGPCFRISIRTQATRSDFRSFVSGASVTSRALALTFVSPRRIQ